ncbi:glycosyltransferase family 39 protein [Cohnella zeiphila]|uniref:Polyprenol-phosphate-mannose--protein mannosyltransferase n=1 Tax=Cohnella zeiphila TaxID=2761120 RepID=A0A7X0VXS1_9BACL|nr:glycosyltransferase family 39 protein [Cohnella zeiphila]MBB6734604.1 glycosyltransferase family 39 protein [Cohnella zeiphila]
MNWKKVASAILLICAILIMSPLAAHADGSDPLIRNGGFEDAASADSGVPSGWLPDVYQSDPDASKLTLEHGDAHSGSAFVRIRNLQPNDARWTQTVAVEPNATYRISAWTRVQGAGADGIGANVSVLGLIAVSADLRDTAGQWQRLELIGTTASGQQELTVAVRLGGYGRLNTGIADFDDVAVEKIQPADGGIAGVPLGTAPGASAAPPSPAAPAGYTGWMWVGALLFAGLFAALLRWLRGSGGAAEPRAERPNPAARTKLPVLAQAQPSNPAAPIALPILVLGAAFLLRWFLAPLVEGHPIDFMDFAGWANRAYAGGLAHFYEGGVFADYPPGYIYVLYVVGWIQHAAGLEPNSAALVHLIKLPAMLADLAVGCLLYRAAGPRTNPRAALVLSALYAASPAVLINSAIWGQMDAVFTLFVVLAVSALARNRTSSAAVWLAVALLIKPQTIVFAPLALFALIDRRSWKLAARFVLSGLATFVLLLLPFSERFNPLWIVGHYKAMFAQYPYTSLNAFNLYALFGLNGKPDTGTFLGLAYKAWDIPVVLAIAAFSAYLYFKSKTSNKLIYIGMLTSLLVFMLKTGMHERYAYPAMALALLSYAQLKDRRILYLFAGLSLTQFANAAYVLRSSLGHAYYISNGDGFMVLVSLANLILTAYAVKLGIELLVRPKKMDASGALSLKRARAEAGAGAEASGKAQAAPPPADSVPPVKMKRLDWLLAGGLTLVYAVVSLIHLGSFSAPQTFWKAAAAGDSAVASFGEARSVGSILWYGGLGNGSFALDKSDDGVAWTPVATLAISDGTVFQWQKTLASFEARYVRVTAEQPAAALGEIGFEEAGSGARLPVQPQGEAPAFDEQGTVPHKPSYLNSAYFDEIYHARTAYENLHGIEAYETTHPPLGKLFMAAGVAVFGMNPFGWRIVGTLLGIGMIPLLYALGLRIFRRRLFAFSAAFLFAADFLHFTQTRVATVDVYGVFFILLMYLFMYRYTEMNFYRVPLSRTLVPLGLSGLFFGIGAACKWIGFYAGAGLALILALTLWERYKEFKAAGKTKLPFASKTGWTLLWCGAFFLLVPAGIYLAAYIPFLNLPGPGHDLAGVLNYQKFMYEYHSGLVATNPFSSSWWEWPLLHKPYWYYAGQSLPAGKISSIVAMGNPAVWWAGIAAVPLTCYYAWKRRDKAMGFVLIALAAEYVPWIGVSRLTFIYHFFATVPFMILCIVYVLRVWFEKRGAAGRGWIYLYLGIAGALFILFYPVLSGMVIDRSYAADLLRWSKGWYFYS